MPTPNRNESKQDFLNRCTRELGSDESAFAECNASWDRHRMDRPTGPVNLSAPLEIERDDGGKREFFITAYTGAPVDTFFGSIVFDSSGMETKEKFPVLREHERDRIVGYAERAWNEGGNIYVKGRMASGTRDAAEVAGLADDGFPWQASVGIWPLEVEMLGKGSVAEVNGMGVEGPVEIWRRSSVGEVSFVALGADDRTAAVVLSKDCIREEEMVEERDSAPVVETVDAEKVAAEARETYKAELRAGREAIRAACEPVKRLLPEGFAGDCISRFEAGEMDPADVHALLVDAIAENQAEHVENRVPPGVGDGGDNALVESAKRRSESFENARRRAR